MLELFQRYVKLYGDLYEHNHFIFIPLILAVQILLKILLNSFIFFGKVEEKKFD